MGFVARDLGIDLGTSSTLVLVKGKGIVLNEPTIVVVDASNEKRVRAVGDDARIALGRTTEGVIAVRPMREGVITDFDMTQILISYFIHSAIGSSYMVRPRVFMSYPATISSIERRAAAEAARYAGARKVYMLPKTLLSALGSGLPVHEPTGCMVVDIGGGTTDVAVISAGGIVLEHSARVGGVKMDEAIAEYLLRENHIIIGDRTAEEIKLDLGSALPLLEERRARVRGRDNETNLPRTVEITSTQVYEALTVPCEAILEVIQWVLAKTPPELASDILHNGIYLTGGASLLYGLDQRIASQFGIPVLLSKEPMECTALGLGNIIDNFELFQRPDSANFLQEY